MLSKLCVITQDTVIQKMSIRTYSELVKLPTFEERYQYLRLDGQVGDATFGHDRYLNQVFYKSKEWLRIRDEVILRDLGCDLGIPGREIFKRVIIHHMNPLSKTDIIDRTDFLLNPEYLICTTKRTHDAIHYSDDSILTPDILPERSANDTCPWRR